jgi:CotH kinase protein
MKQNKPTLLLVLLLTPLFSIAQVTFTSSNLPIIVINTNGQAIVDDPKITADMGIIYNGPGVRNHIGDTYNNFNGKIGIEFHGSSQQMFPKKPYGIEIHDATGNSIDAVLLGMPKKDDWVLLAAYDDKSLMRDALAYKLGRDQGRYASRTRFCEVVLNGEYVGIYILVEKVKRDKNRVNIAKLDPTSVSGDALTGGYIVKIDKTTGSGGAGWTSPFRPLGSLGSQTIYFQYEYPKEEDIVTEQKAYIESEVTAFETALSGDNFKDSIDGYAKYADVSSFVDYFIMNEITKNPDGYRLSTFLYKKRDSDGGRLFAGPIWDFNEGFGNVNYCTQGNSAGFVLEFNSICPSDGWQIPFWWGRLFEDKKFGDKVVARWTSLRNGPFKTNTILSYVDSVATVLNVEAQARNFTKWPVLGQYVWPNYYVGNSFQDEVNWLKDWIEQRLTWLDANISNYITAVDEASTGFTFQAYPNPFAQNVEFEYEIDKPGLFSMDAFDALGRKLNHVEQTYLAKGKYQLNQNQAAWPSGIYYFKASFDRKVIVRKLLKR